jgi:thioredoxin reductase/NAD-dependent dihydropyrimidine dehydrogenase PreA subunit
MVLHWVLAHFEWVLLSPLVAFVLWRISSRNRAHSKAKKALTKAVKSGVNEPLSLHPEIDPALCAGCGSCTRVCPEGEVLQLINHKATLVAPTKCVGHGECEQVCPMGAISLVFGTKTRGVDIPRVSSDYQTNIPGLYIAGELGGMGLIRNALKQGALAARHAIKTLTTDVKADYDILIVGAGPAGLAASLVAIEQRKSYLCIEQNSFGGTVYNFPRQKIVMTAPADLPLVGKMAFSKNKVSKEELLHFWQTIRAKTDLKIQERTRFESLENCGTHFEVKMSRGGATESITAKKVILATGVRGSPRRLGLANEDLSKVAYNLIDPEQSQGQNIVVVGGGNAGVEAAQYLARAKYGNRVILAVRGNAFDRCNEENQNIIRKMESEGLVQIWFNSKVVEIAADSLLMEKGSERLNIPNDYLFVFAGAEIPSRFLMSLGVAIDKKFGEGLSKSG